MDLIINEKSRKPVNYLIHLSKTKNAQPSKAGRDKCIHQRCSDWRSSGRRYLDCRQGALRLQKPLQDREGGCSTGSTDVARHLCRCSKRGSLIFMFWPKPLQSKQYRASLRRAVVMVAVAFLAPAVAGRAAAITLVIGF